MTPSTYTASFTLFFCPVRGWPALVRHCFGGDAQLLATYHVAAPCALETAVTDTYLTLRAGTSSAFELFALVDTATNAVAGMVGLERGSNVLITFALASAYRGAAGAAELVRLIRSLSNPHEALYCALYAHNLPAIKFLLRMGFKNSQPVISPTTGKPGYLFTLDSN